MWRGGLGWVHQQRSVAPGCLWTRHWVETRSVLILQNVMKTLFAWWAFPHFPDMVNVYVIILCVVLCWGRTQSLVHARPALSQGATPSKATKACSALGTPPRAPLLGRHLAFLSILQLQALEGLALGGLSHKTISSSPKTIRGGVYRATGKGQNPGSSFMVTDGYHSSRFMSSLDHILKRERARRGGRDVTSEWREFSSGLLLFLPERKRSDLDQTPLAGTWALGLS